MVDCTLLCRVRKSCARFRMRTRAPFFRVLASIFMCFAQYCSRENPSAPSAGISFSVSCDESLDAPSSLRRFSEHKARATCAVCAFALHGTNADGRAYTLQGSSADLHLLLAAQWSSLPNTSHLMSSLGATLATAALYFASASSSLFEAAAAVLATPASAVACTKL